MHITIDGIRLIQPTVFRDDRGWFQEQYNKSRDLFGRDIAQVSQSWSRPFTRRGMHFQYAPPMTKIVTVLVGEARFIVLDLRKTKHIPLLQYDEFRITSTDFTSIIIPAYCALGFETFEEPTLVQYLHSEIANVQTSITLDASLLNIRWENTPHHESLKDRHHGLTLEQWRNHQASQIIDRM